MTLGKVASVFGLAALAALPALLAAAPAQAREDEVLRDGRQAYQENCTACHGDSAKGDGPMAEILTIKPADLTEIAKKNGGVFPFWRVYGIIDNTIPMKGHAYMPNFESRFRSEEQKPGYAPSYLRILALTHWLESIQEK